MSDTTTFNFRAGNAKKLASIPLYGLGKLASLLVSRKPDRWVFGSGVGIGEGALAVYREALEQLPDASLTWLISTEQQRAQAEAAHIRWAWRDGWRGFWCTLRASTIVITHGFGDVHRFGVFGGFVVQLWHGIPLKKLHLDTTVTLETGRRGSRVLRRMYRRGGSAISMFAVASDLVGARIQSAFNLKPGVLTPIGDPRDDELINSDSSEARQHILDLLSLGDDASQLVLYAPTWRDGGVDPAVPSHEEWVALEQWAEGARARVIIRAHPLGLGSYERDVATRVHLLSSKLLSDITPLLGAFDALVTDYSSIAFDFSLTGQPIVWFAPDREAYEQSRGLYESYEQVTEGVYEKDWAGVQQQLTSVLGSSSRAKQAKERSVKLAERHFALRDGASAQRVVDEILRRRKVKRATVSSQVAGAPSTVYFESFYGRQVACNPRAIDAEIARVAPSVSRVWGVADPSIEVPPGAAKVVLGTSEAKRARERADLIIANDWLRKDFVVSKQQRVLQTWHGTMLKRLALDRPKVSLRTKFAVKRESRKWDVLLSQNPHSSTFFRSSYDYRGAIWQDGYPRDDELSQLTRAVAHKRLGIKKNMRVLVYAPTWRDAQRQPVDALRIESFAKKLPKGWVLLVRGHSRTHGFGGYTEGVNTVRDVSTWPNVNDVIAAADLFVTDYSSLMFDASVARVPMAFFTPDIAKYRDAERGFTFDFEQDAPGPLLSSQDELLELLDDLDAMSARYAERYEHWVQRFNPHDDGQASQRVVARLFQEGYISG
jgi:CDP-glycerol glycerophosphotransferase